MFCPKCGTKNDDEAQFCQNCGTSFKTSSDDSKKLIFVVAIVAILVIGALAGIYMVVSSSNDNTPQTVNVITEEESTNVESSEQKSNPSSQADWHKVDSYHGVSDFSKSIPIKGSKVKVVFSAFPIKNYAENDLTVKIYKGAKFLGSANVFWDGDDDVATRSNSIEAGDGSGTYQIDVDAYELQYWDIIIYEWY